MKRFVTTLTSQKITELLSRNECELTGKALPKCIKSVQCNQLASNSPIEDRLRVSSIQVPGTREPSLILGVFDGHGGGTTADLISDRLFNYIALSLHPDANEIKISNQGDLQKLVVDLHCSPKPRVDLGQVELEHLSNYKSQVKDPSNIAHNLRTSFQRCDDDLAEEIQRNLTSARTSRTILHHYLSAAVSGCCALVVLIHEGVGYVASSGDCRAVLGKHNKFEAAAEPTDNVHDFSAIDLNEEHNCDNINEVRRLNASHPKSEQNTMIKHNRLLGHLMPFRAFGDYTYKWPTELIKACGITTAFGSGVIPSHYETPPYLIAEPDVRHLELEDNKNETNSTFEEKYLVVASDGLWELFESSRDVIETIVDHSENSSRPLPGLADEYDKNCATHILRSALRYSSPHDIGLSKEELKKLYHIRLESALTLPQAVVRNFRDDISIVMLRLQ